MPESCPRTQDGFSDPQTLGSNPQHLKDFLSSAAAQQPRLLLSTPSSGAQVTRARPYVRVTRGRYPTPCLLPTLPGRNDCSPCFKGRTDGPGPRGVSVQPPEVAQTYCGESPDQNILWPEGWLRGHSDGPHAPKSMPWPYIAPPTHPRAGRKEKRWIDKADGGFNKKLTRGYKKSCMVCFRQQCTPDTRERPSWVKPLNVGEKVF